MIVGVPKEIKVQEHRVGLTPVSVRELVRSYQEHRSRHPKGTFRLPVEVSGMARTPAALRSGIFSAGFLKREKTMGDKPSGIYF
jgi:hypothetical protein